MKKSFPHALGCVLASLFGLIHIVWSLLVAVGWAQPVADFVFRLHMISPYIHVLPFDLPSALLLIVMTTTGGYFVGWVVGSLWMACGSLKK